MGKARNHLRALREAGGRSYKWLRVQLGFPQYPWRPILLVEACRSSRRGSRSSHGRRVRTCSSDLRLLDFFLDVLVFCYHFDSDVVAGLFAGRTRESPRGRRAGRRRRMLSSKIHRIRLSSQLRGAAFSILCLICAFFFRESLQG